ncbi:pentatricopeptide repeat-containing protein [Prunus yedoensis var. nudiflora]|uniref:Pentatricopeptide repeat-containing protein n=1 Tax=Prunus yedoensis var. nudiflora TaxID=2094558 RepID=A0A314ZFC5_PRUYE|nr:pentatricopeptide repeat-containing protein [Prunus yedoensis var. nudiflora]
MNQLKQIQSQMFLLGLHQDRFTLSKLMAFCTEPSLGNMNYAEKVVHYIQNPCLFVYIRMIKEFAKTGSFRSAFELFRRLREEGLWPDSCTYPFVFKAIGCLREPREGAKVHGLLVKPGFEFDAYGMLGAGGLRMLLICSSGCDVRAIRSLMRLRTVVSTLSACTALKNLELGKQIHDYVKSELKLMTTIIGNALLNMYAKCGCLNEGRRIFDEIPSKNVICCTSMVSGSVNCGRLDEAREVFDGSSIKDAGYD